MHRWAAVAFISLLLSAGTASAQTWAQSPAPIWSGIYLGAHGGGEHLAQRELRIGGAVGGLPEDPHRFGRFAQRLEHHHSGSQVARGTLVALAATRALQQVIAQARVHAGCEQRVLQRCGRDR